MSTKGFCPAHGPYEGSTCPYPPPHTKSAHQPSSSSRPLDDDLPTDVGGYKPVRPAPPNPLNSDDLPTDLEVDYISNTSSGNRFNESEAPPTSTRARHGILDYDNEDETQLGRMSRDDVTELDVTPVGTLCMIWVKEGSRRGRFYPVHHGLVVGRKEGGLILDDPKVSSAHAKFTMEDDQFFVWDFGSSNGTYVNGKKIRKATLLEENDLIKIGDTVFVVKLLESDIKRKPPTRTRRNTQKGGHTTEE